MSLLPPDPADYAALDGVEQTSDRQTPHLRCLLSLKLMDKPSQEKNNVHRAFLLTYLGN